MISNASFLFYVLYLFNCVLCQLQCQTFLLVAFPNVFRLTLWKFVACQANWKYLSMKFLKLKFWHALYFKVISSLIIQKRCGKLPQKGGYNINYHLKISLFSLDFMLHFSFQTLALGANGSIADLLYHFVCCQHRWYVLWLSNLANTFVSHRSFTYHSRPYIWMLPTTSTKYLLNLSKTNSLWLPKQKLYFIEMLVSLYLSEMTFSTVSARKISIHP